MQRQTSTIPNPAQCRFNFTLQDRQSPLHAENLDGTSNVDNTQPKWCGLQLLTSDHHAW